MFKGWLAEMDVEVMAMQAEAVSMMLAGEPVVTAVVTLLDLTSR